MSMRTRLAEIFNRKTAPQPDNSRAIAWIPAKRGGIIVTHEKALELSTCFACVRVISEDVAKLPWNVFQKSGNTRTRLDSSQLHRLLNSRPNPEMGSFAFRETLMAWALTWGNGYAEIERDLGGRVLALWPIAPDRVKVDRDENGSIIYSVSNGRGPDSIVPARDMFHLHGMGFDGLQGYSMVGLAAQSLGFAIAAEEHGSSFYGNNTVLGTTFQTDAVLSDEGFQRMQEDISGRKGSKRAYEGMILEQGLKLVNSNMSQVDAQYIETRRQQVEEIARWWRVPPHKLQELSKAHFANVENLNIDYATDTLMPWIKRMEEEADWKLIGPRSQASYTKIAIQALMRGDSEARAKFYNVMFNIGVFSQNDILAFEDMDPIGPEGDEHYIQVNMTTLKKINQDDPQEIVRPAIENLAKRLFEIDMKRAEPAKRKYDREGFERWVDRHNEKHASSRESAVNDLLPSLEAAHRKEVDVNKLLADYASAVKQQLMNFYNGKTPDHGAIRAVFFEVIT